MPEKGASVSGTGGSRRRQKRVFAVGKRSEGVFLDGVDHGTAFAALSRNRIRPRSIVAAAMLGFRRPPRPEGCPNVALGGYSA